MRVAALIGEPAVGKSTLARAVLARLGPTWGEEGSYLPWNLLKGTRHHGDIYVLGTYAEGEKFGGTDRLSMAVQPYAEQFVSALNTGASVFFEGDRLGNIKFLNACRRYARVRVFVLEASEETKARRHKERGDTQTEKFLKGRKTKIANILKEFPRAVRLPNENLADIKAAEVAIINFLRGGE